MVELGAGWGRWTTNAAAAYRQLNPNGELQLVAVEAESTHFRFLGEHLARNRVDATALEAAVAAEPGRVLFDVGDPAGWYGQSIQARDVWWRRLRPRADRVPVRAITLAQALEPIDGPVDLLDLDVQGAEADVLTAGAGELERVRCVHVETHSADQDERLRTLFDELGWECRTDYAFYSTVAETWWGGRGVFFEGGVQSWLNPEFRRSSL